MTTQEATAEVFLAAFISLPEKAQDSFIQKILRNPRLREDIIDLAIAEERNKEKTKPFGKVVANLRKNRSR